MYGEQYDLRHVMGDLQSASDALLKVKGLIMAGKLDEAEAELCGLASDVEYAHDALSAELNERGAA